VTIHAEAVTQAHPLAAGLDPNSVSPGLLGFIIVVIIGIVTWFLARSMAKHLRKLEANRPEQDEPAQSEADTPPVSGPKPGSGPQPNGAH
jgi:hypothetical protein